MTSPAWRERQMLILEMIDQWGRGSKLHAIDAGPLLKHGASTLHFEPTTIPGLVGDDFLIPASVTKFLRKLFRRPDTPAAR